MYFGSTCGTLAASKSIWVSFPPGSVLAAPVCSDEEFDQAYSLLYKVNCEVIWGNSMCGNPKGKLLTCDDFQWPGLDRIGFVAGYILLEKRDTAQMMQSLGSGFFLSAALSLQPPTDKVTKHQFQLLYERYFPSKRAPAGSFLEVVERVRHQQRVEARLRMLERYLRVGQKSPRQFLEIGLGCNMEYGPGKSAELWKTYFPEMHITFLEYDAQCVRTWQQKVESMGITVYVGDQELPGTNKLVAEKAGPDGYDIVVDDGAHTNTAMRTSFEYLWPAMAAGGFYVIEDLGQPAFSYKDCEPIQAMDQKQNRTALAKVLEMARPLVMGHGQHEAARIECDLGICLLQKS